MRQYLFLIFIFFSAHFFAQLERRNLFIGTNVMYHQQHVENEGMGEPRNSKNSALYCSLIPGKFIRDRFLFGALLSYTNTYTRERTFGPKITSTEEFRTIATGLGIFTRFYSSPVGGKLSFFGQLDILYENINGNGTSRMEGAAYGHSNYSNTGRGYSAGLRPGLVYFISKKLGIEACFGSLRFSQMNNTRYQGKSIMNKWSVTDFNVDFSLPSFLLGIALYID